MHKSTFEYLMPTADQIAVMSILREASKEYAETLDRVLPDGPDKTFILRNHRTNAMWANVAVTRDETGAPRI